MSRIKSALELALEKTENLHVDKEAIDRKAHKAEGRKLAQTFMDAPDSVNLAQAIKKFPGKNAVAAKEGALEALLGYVKLPVTEALPDKLQTVLKGLISLKGGLFPDKEITAMFQQLEGFLKQYVGDMKNIEENAIKQFAPKLRQKEQELAARTGRATRIDPHQDPEFLAFLNKNVNAIRTQYQDALDQAKAQLAELIGP